MRRVAALAGVGGAAGVLAALFGVGGGIVIVPSLIARGWQAHRATATSLAAIGATAVFGAVRYSFDGLVVWHDALLDRRPGRRRRRVRHDARQARARSAPAAGIRVRDGRGRRQAGLVSHVALAVALGLAGGVLAGLFGVGGGIVFVPALTLGLGLSQLSGEATSLAAIVPVVAVGSFRQHRSGLVEWRSAGLIGLCSLAGVLVGAEIALSLPESTLRRAFALFLLISAAQMALRARHQLRTP